LAVLNDVLPNSKLLSVLVMDPNTSLREHLVQDLKSVFLHVDETSTAYEGISFCKINDYDIVLLDQEIPNMTSAQIIQNILEVKPSQAIVYFTHDDSVQTLIDISNMQICSIVSKPMNRAKFYEQLKRVCDNFSGHESLLPESAFAKSKKSSHQKISPKELLEHEKVLEELASEKRKTEQLIVKNRELSNLSCSITEEVNKVKYFNSITKIENKHSLQHALKEKGSKALIYFNINQFDMINSLYGMGMGNKVLEATASKIVKFLPENAKLFNVNVDEFVVMIIQPRIEQEMLLADQIIALFSELPLEVAEHKFDITFSTGVVRGDGLQLFVQSKIASKESKYHGSSAVTVFANNSEYMEKQRKDLFWIKTLKTALSENRVICYYQPIVDNMNNKIEHFEVLCRLKESDGNIISAGRFIQAAQEVGFVTKLTRIMLDQAFKHFSTNAYKFSVNICHADLYEDYLLEYIEYKCDLYNIHPSRLYLELIGESSLENSDIVLSQISRLREAGVHIGIDDINMDYSVFSRMLRLNVDYVKIDRSFIKNIAENNFNQDIVTVIVEFAKKSGMKTIAEHVETHDELQAISRLGVDYSQGYFIGKPSHNALIPDR